MAASVQPDASTEALDAAVEAAAAAIAAHDFAPTSAWVAPSYAEAAIAAAWPIIAAAVEAQARADERERIAAWVEAECVDLDDDGEICEGCEDTAACIRRGDTTSRLTGGDPDAAIASAGTSGGES